MNYSMIEKINGFEMPKTIGFVAATALVSVVFVAAIMSAHADAAPVISTTIQNSSDATVSAVPIGTLVHAVGAVASSTGACRCES